MLYLKYAVSFLFVISAFIYSQVNQDWVRKFSNTNDSISYSNGLVIDNDQNIYAGGVTVYNSQKKFAFVKYNSYGGVLFTVFYSNPSFSLYTFYQLVLDPVGNIYVIGDCIDPITGQDIIILKYNSNGILLFMRKFDYGGDEGGVGACCDNYGNIYITGFSQKINSEFITMKYNSLGILQWIKPYNTREDYHYYSNTISVDRNLNVSVAGRYWLDLNTMNYIIIKYNPNGVLKWIKRINGPNNNTNANCRIINDDNGNLYFIGGIDREIADIDIAVLKFDPNGNLLWENYYNGTSNATDEPTSITIDPFGYICITGYSCEMNYIADCIIIKYSPSGEIQWKSTYNGTANQYDRGCKIISDESGNLYVTGYTENEPVTGYDYLTLKYNPKGMLQWLKTYSGESHSTDLSNFIVKDQSDNIYVSGWSENGITTIKYSQVIGIEPINSTVPEKFALYQNYPNPFNPTTKIKFDLPKSNLILSEAKDLLVRLIVYDLLGREVATIVNEQLKPGTYEVEWDGSRFGSGVYLYKLIAAEYMESKRMILIK